MGKRVKTPEEIKAKQEEKARLKFLEAQRQTLIKSLEASDRMRAECNRIDFGNIRESQYIKSKYD